MRPVNGGLARGEVGGKARARDGGRFETAAAVTAALPARHRAPTAAGCLLGATDPAPGRTTSKEEIDEHDRRNDPQRRRHGQLYGTLDALKADPTLATFQFRARNRWIDGAHNRTTIRDFYAANQEDTSRDRGVRPRRRRAGDPARAPTRDPIRPSTCCTPSPPA